MYVYTAAMKQTPASQILQQIAQIQHMEPGKLCVIGQGPHGPYYNLQCRQQGKTLTRYVPGDQAPLVAQHTPNYQNFQPPLTQHPHPTIKQPPPPLPTPSQTPPPPP